MKIKTLSKWEMTCLYYTRMVKDFPPSERKPLIMILRGMKAGNYTCYGLADGKAILGYAIFVKLGNRYLFDYLAVHEKHRSSGVGATFLALLSEHFKEADSVIGEVENPALAKSDEEQKLQERRLGFYLRNGYVDTGVLVKLFGVDYKVIMLDLQKRYTQEEIKEIYKAHYKAMLPKQLYETMVSVQ